VVATPTETAPTAAPLTPTALPDTPTPEPPSPTSEPPTPVPTLEPTLPPTEEPTATPTETATAEPEATGTPRPTRPPATQAPPQSRKTPTPDTSGEPPPPAWREVVRAAPGNNRIALTFDAGASGEPLPRILGTLRERNIRVTMFFTGKFAEKYPEGVKQAVADGHEIANHTYSHLDSKTLSDEELAGELARTETIIRNLTGVSTKPYWRPPFGARDNRVLRVAATQGYRSIYWTLDSLDSVGEAKTPEFIFNRVTNTPGVNLDGAIILQHFGSDASADSLPRVLDRLHELGLKVVTVSELLSP
jgi:peptidoglycan-N-acetylmuramic acid deacetylase